MEKEKEFLEQKPWRFADSITQKGNQYYRKSWVVELMKEYADQTQGSGKAINKSKLKLKDNQYDLTFIIDKDHELLVVDNSQVDYKGFIDCNTLFVRQLIFEPELHD